MTGIFLCTRNYLSIPEGVSVATVALMGWMWRLRAGWDEHLALGSFRQDPRALRPARRKAVRQSEEDRAEVRTGSRNRRKSVGAVCVTRRTSRPALLRRLRSRNPSLLACPGNGITVSTNGEAMPTLALLPSREKVARNAPDEGAFAATTQLHQTHPSPVTHYVSATLSLKGRGKNALPTG